MKKFILISMLFVFTLTAVGVGLLWPQKSKATLCSAFDTECLKSEMKNQPMTAQPALLRNTALDVAGGTPKGPFDDISAAIRWLVGQIKQKLKEAYQQAGDIAYKNSLRYFLNRVAYDTATYIATGGAGKKPLFITNFPEYFKSVGDEAVGEFFYQLGKEMWGKNLCEPWQPLVKIDLTVAAKRALEPRRPTCTWNKIKKNMNDLRDLEFDELVQLSAHFQPGANELGAYLTMRTGAYEYRVKQENEANLVRIIEGGFKSVVNPITGAIKTPAGLVGESMKVAYQKTFSSMEVYTGSPVADAIGTFTNTLVSKYLERIFKKGFNPGGQVVVNDFWSLGGVPAARLYFSELAEPDYKFNIGMSLDELSISGQEQYNGIINDSFTKAIEEKCTVGQAVGFYKPGSEAYRAECFNLISGMAVFGFDQDGVEPKPENGLPYRSILALRKFRIVPVGWELAAAYYKNFYLGKEQENKLNLNFLVAQYDKKFLTDGTTVNPYYGLVDPDWLLKLPITRCVRKGASPRIIQETFTFAYCASDVSKTEPDCPEGNGIYAFERQEYCADYETCLDDSGNKCDVNNYGYCIEEKPIWSIKGTKCASKYYASCQGLTKTDNTAGQVNYLLNTVSGKNICDENNAGCREYCTNLEKPFTNNNWTCASGSAADKTYLVLSGKDKECSKSAEGCTLVYKSASKDKAKVEAADQSDDYSLLDKKYVRIAPDYYQCPGYTKKVVANTKEECLILSVDNFWRDDLNVCVDSGSKECANFAKHCTIDDANCKLYTPVNSGRAGVPAVILPKDCLNAATGDCKDEKDPAITWHDECPNSCVGYKNYHQSKTYFEPEEDVKFIASTGKTCSEPGCDQFTNLDEVARGGEGIEYFSYLRQCIKPDANDTTQKTYYTWEGSDTAGYQLKKWLLLADNSGVPQGDECFDLTNKDCREFYDQSLQTYWRFYSSTIVVSDDCHPYRRTLDPAGSEPYMAVPKESTACSAGNNMCREYKSAEGYNYQKIISSSFSSQDTEGWNGGVIRNESVRRNDYSLKVSGSATHGLVAGDLEQGKIYTLEFLAKGTGSVSAKFTDGKVIVESVTVTITHENEWWPYTLKLPKDNIGLALNQTDNQKIEITINGYLDNIVLKKIQSLYLIKNSWTTPIECETGDELVNGTAQESMLGCEAYKNSEGKIVNLRKFNKLCFEDVVGCEAIIDTNNTEDFTKHILDYMVLDNKFMCLAKDKGCTRLGLITPNRDDATQYSFTDQYKLVNPDDVNQQCAPEAVFCDSYSYQDENNNIITYNFKDPLGMICEFKDGKWVKSGTTDACVITSADEFNNKYKFSNHCIGGVALNGTDSCTINADCTNLASPGSEGICSNWVGLCNEASSNCREYQDPQNPVGCKKNYVNYLNRYDFTVSEKQVCNYYYYKDVEPCSGGVAPSQGCVGFKDGLDPNLNIRSFKVCDNDTTITCDTDNDCNNGGRCRYVNTQQIIPNAIPQQ